MLQAANAPFLPSRRIAPAPQRKSQPAAGGPRVISLHRPHWRRAAVALQQWWLAWREQALARQRCRQLAQLDAATQRDLGLGGCARPDPLPDWASYERARW